MKTEFKLKSLLTMGLGLCVGIGFCHEVAVHQFITENATDSALNLSPAYSGFLNTVSSDIIISDARKYLSEGSAREDDIDVPGDLGRKRSLGHFYDPLTGLGLAEIPVLGSLQTPLGVNSFIWASVFNCAGLNSRINPNPVNVWSWQNARDYEWNGLTAASQTARQVALTNMFRAVGQVIHLLEDTSQPQHTRNEQHLDQILHHNTPWRSPIEDYGKANLANLNYQHAMLDWRGAGFNKVEDFWDRQLYTGNAPALNGDASGGSKLGLAEFSNGNFLGARHLYPEYFNAGSAEYYPFPSRDTSTNYKQVKANPSVGLETFALANGQQVKGIYIKKTGDGIALNHHSRMNYLGAKKISGLTGRSFCTIKDDKVLEDYHAILIPKAVEYSAGILDYFFRGQLETSLITADATSYQFKITNKSGEDLSGGAFQLFGDDDLGNRTELAGFTVASWSGSLADGDSLNATLTLPTTTVIKYTLVYRGTIGTSGGGDPVDVNIAIAAITVPPPPAWWKLEEASGNRVDSVQSIALIPSAGVTTGTGKIAGGVSLPAANSWDALQTAATEKLGYNAGTSVSLVGWFRINSPGGSIALEQADVKLNLWHDAAATQPAGGLSWVFLGNGYETGWVRASGAGGVVNTPYFTPGQEWHFCHAFYDAKSGKIGVQLDGGPVYETPATPTLASVRFGTLEINFSDSPLYPGSVGFDEVGVFFQRLSASEVTHIYNSGSGRTWPIVFP